MMGNQFWSYVCARVRASDERRRDTRMKRFALRGWRSFVGRITYQGVLELQSTHAAGGASHHEL